MSSIRSSRKKFSLTNRTGNKSKANVNTVKETAIGKRKQKKIDRQRKHFKSHRFEESLNNSDTQENLSQENASNDCG